MEIQKLNEINEKLKKTDIKGKDYVEVNQRILAFWELYPNGKITTEIINLVNGTVTMRATVYDGNTILVTGHAQEKESSSFINKTSFIENCETSAIGRALGILGIGATSSIASAEEVINAIGNQKKSKLVLSNEEQKFENPLNPKLITEAKALNIQLEKLAVYYKCEIDELTDEMLAEAITLKKAQLDKEQK